MTEGTRALTPAATARCERFGSTLYIATMLDAVRDGRFIDVDVLGVVPSIVEVHQRNNDEGAHVHFNLAQVSLLGAMYSVCHAPSRCIGRAMVRCLLLGVIMMRMSEVGQRMGDAYAVLRAMFQRPASMPKQIAEGDRRVVVRQDQQPY